MTTEKRRPGRPTLPPGERLLVVPVRLSVQQKAKLQRIGVQRLRDWLDRVREGWCMDNEADYWKGKAEMLEAVVARLGPDATRYRWLQRSGCWPAVFADSQAAQPLRGDALDAAIEDAMTRRT